VASPPQPSASQRLDELGKKLHASCALSTPIHRGAAKSSPISDPLCGYSTTRFRFRLIEGSAVFPERGYLSGPVGKRWQGGAYHTGASAFPCLAHRPRWHVRVRTSSPWISARRFRQHQSPARPPRILPRPPGGRKPRDQGPGPAGRHPDGAAGLQTGVADGVEQFVRPRHRWVAKSWWF